MKVGIIGCGKIAERHILAYKKNGITDIACYDIDQNRAKEYASRYSIRQAVSVEAIYHDPEIAAINICTPTASHSKYVIEAIRHNKHVFCEKPLAGNLDEAILIQNELAKSKLILMVGYLYRFFPAFKFVKQVLEDRIIGKPYFAIFRLGGRGSQARWKHQSGGGGAILEMLVHELDLVYWFFGKTDQLQSLWQSTLFPEREIQGEVVQATAEDCILFRLSTNGTEVICQSDLITPSYMQYLEIQGDNGSIFSSMLHYLPTTVFCKKGRGIFSSGHNFHQFPAINAHEEELKHFLSAIKGEDKVVNSVSDSIEVIKLVNKLTRAYTTSSSSDSGYSR